MSDLFEYAPIEDVDREFVDYVGVHPLSWYDCKEPTAAFIESKYTTEIVDDLLAACEELVAICEDVMDGLYECDSFTLNPAKAAIAKVQEDNDA